MTPNELLLQAIQLAIDAHGMQLDKAGKLYVLHPLHVMNSVDSIDAKIVAVLHDVIEDTQADIGTDRACIVHRGGTYLFPAHIIEALDAITKREGEKKEEYWTRVAKNILATSVKFKDMEHNSSEERLRELDPEEAEYLRRKYKRAEAFIAKQFSYNFTSDVQ